MNNIALIAFFSVFLTHSSPIFYHLNRPFRESRSFAAELSPFCYATDFAMQAMHFATAFALLCKDNHNKKKSVSFLFLGALDILQESLFNKLRFSFAVPSNLNNLEKYS